MKNVDLNKLKECMELLKANPKLDTISVKESLFIDILEEHGFELSEEDFESTVKECCSDLKSPSKYLKDGIDYLNKKYKEDKGE